MANTFTQILIISTLKAEPIFKITFSHLVLRCSFQIAKLAKTVISIKFHVISCRTKREIWLKFQNRFCFTIVEYIYSIITNLCRRVQFIYVRLGFVNVEYQEIHSCMLPRDFSQTLLTKCLNYLFNQRSFWHF